MFKIIYEKHIKCIKVGVYKKKSQIREKLNSLRQKTCLQRVANNTGAYQPAHPHSLISVLESVIYRLDTSEISCFLFVSVAEQAGLNPEDRFSRGAAHII